MTTTSVPLLLIAAGTVGFLHSILPDHWVPLAVIARAQRWSLIRTARVSFLASIGHVLTSIVLAGIIAAVGLQFRQAFETQQGHIVGIILVLTGIGFLVWALTGHGHHHHGEHGHDHPHDSDAHHEQDHEHTPGHIHPHTHAPEQNRPRRHGAHALAGHDSALGRFAAIAVPFGAAASPDLTILPVALAAAAVGVGAVVGALATFTLVTLATFVVLTVAATVAGYQVRGDWLDEHGSLITALVLIAIGVAVYVGL